MDERPVQVQGDKRTLGLVDRLKPQNLKGEEFAPVVVRVQGVTQVVLGSASLGQGY